MAVACDKIMKVYNTDGAGLYYRSGPGVSNSPLGISAEGEQFRCTQEENNWFFIETKNGWSSGTYLQLIQDNSTNETQEVSKDENDEAAKKAEEERKKQEEEEAARQRQLTIEAQEEVYVEYMNSTYSSATSASFNDILNTNLASIYGAPYQFPDSVDRKMDNTKFGYYYSERILTKMPLLMMSPGKVSFMQDFKNSEKLPVIDSLLKGVANTSNDAAEDTNSLSHFLTTSGKYYTFDYDEQQYWKYVNGMNRMCALYLGINDVEVDINGAKGNLSSFKWEDASNANMNTWMMSKQSFVTFYTDATSSKNEDFSNNTTESQLASKVNSFSDMAREVQFLLGAGFGKQIESLQQDNIANLQASVDKIADDYLNKSQLFKDLGRDFSIIATGGKLIFPEIWADSEFSQSFDVNIKLRCPSPNLLQWYLDICVPLNHLIAFVMPRTPAGFGDGAKTDGGNGYCTPFLVRAFYKGLFNCDMGIVTSLSISKGSEGMWSIDGLPSVVDVSMTIKDLYNVMAMSNPDNVNDFMNNTTFMNYLANTCGICINIPDVERSAETFFMLEGNKIKEKYTGYNIWRSYQNITENNWYHMWKAFMGTT